MAEDRYDAETFMTIRETLPERGQWSELAAGRPIHFQPPETIHTFVLHNLNAHIGRLVQLGTPVFQTGLTTRKSPDTVRFPAVSLFRQAGRFDLVDAELLDEPPDWVIEIASTADRLKTMPDRVAEYVAFGVKLIWIIDATGKSVHTVGGTGDNVVTGDAVLSAAPVFDFRTTAAELLDEMPW